MKTVTVILAMIMTGFVHVDASGQTLLTNFCVTDGAIYAIAVSGTTVYIGGDFTWAGPQSGIGGSPRQHLAAFDAVTGQLTSWNPGADNLVYALAVSGSTVFAGGDFTYIGGQSRNRIASLNITNGQATSWNPGVNGFVFSIAISGSTVYIGGLFGYAGNQNRLNIAALSTTSNTALSWNPGADQTVRCLLLSGGTLYVGGQFTYIGGQSRMYIAALSTSSNTATTWNPGADSYVYGLALSGSTLYAGGNFTYIGGTPRSYVAALNTSSNSPTSWNAGATSAVRAIAIAGSYLYCGGQFHGMGGQPRNFLGSFSLVNGQTTSWNPNLGGIVRAVAVTGTTVFAGGDFGSAQGVSRTHFAAFSDAGLPVQLVNFQGRPVSSSRVLLEWRTLSETNNHGFEVERRMEDDPVFTPLPESFIPGFGTTLVSHSYQFVDSQVVVKRLEYRLKQIDLDGAIHYSEPIVVSVVASISGNPTPEEWVLMQNYPNPFNPNTTIRFHVPPGQSTVRIAIYTVLGGLVWEETVEGIASGEHQLVWNGTGQGGAGVPSGVYLYRLTSGGYSATKRMILVR